MRGIWLPNLKKWLTGTNVSSSYGIDVNVINAAVPTVGAALAYKERRVHLPATTAINGSAGAWVELDAVPGVTGGAAISNTCTAMKINWNGGDILEIGEGANAGAVTVIATVGAGQTTDFGVALVATDKVWVRSVKTTGSTAGELTISFLG